MTGKQSLLTDLYEDDPIRVPKYPTEFDAVPAQQCFEEVNVVEGRLNCDQINAPTEEDMSVASSSDDPGAAAAVFQHLDNLLRQRLDGEIEQLRTNVHRILTDQQLEFAQAFGLNDDLSSSEASHVVPQTNYCDDTSSDECQLITEDSSDSEGVRRCEIQEEKFCSNCKSALDPVVVSQEEQEKIATKYLIRLLTASSIISNTLQRKEYRT